MKKVLIIASLFLFNTSLYSQLTIINTGTLSNINRISIIENYIVVNGRTDYIAKCYDECDTLIPLTVPGPAGYYNYDLNRIDTDNFFILSSSNTNFYDHKIYKSSDGGNSWYLKFDTTGSSSGLFLNKLAFFDTLEGIATGTFYKSIRTQDGGNTWTNEYDISNPFIITTAIEIFGDSTICMGTNESFCISHDRGNTRTCSTFGIQASPRDFFFLNKDTLFATSVDNNGDYFSYSFNMGATWVHYYFQIPINPYGIYFLSAAEGYVVGSDGNYGVILKTTDLGQNWSVFNTQITTLLTDIKFLNDSIALIAGTGGVLLKWNSKNFSTNIPEFITSYFNLKIYPNPTNGKFSISTSEKMEAIEIYNMLGAVILKSKINPETSSGLKSEIDISNHTPGIYFIRIKTKDNFFSQKIVKH